ncbi:MAG: rod shape-determining protein MreC [Clostridia bacterium]|nr:rod shape-determining protein MreC [Clostridia bacterium]
MRLGTIKSRFFPISLAVSILLSILSIVIYHTNSLTFIYGAVGLVASPIHMAADAVTDGVAELSKYFADIDRLTKENERLAGENEKLVAENRDTKAIEEENKWLRNFIGLKTERTSLTLVDAKIVARDVGFIRTFTLDKGSFHGISKNMPVITEKGLLGIITETSPNTSRGISLLNHNMSVGVYMERTMTSAVLTGSFELHSKGLCKVINLPSDSDVVVGDPVYTSGYGGIYPKDVAVGTVVSIEPNPANYTLSAIVQPAADMSLSDYVMVVTGSMTLYE